MEISDNILNSLKCSKCYFILSYPPIRILQDGSSICGRCTVPEKELKLSVIDKPYEKLAKIINFPCKYSKQGCNEKTTFDETILHENSCKYREVICPEKNRDSKCVWNGKRDELWLHFKEQHAKQIVDHPCKMIVNLDQSVANLLTMAHGFIFMIQLIYNEKEEILWHSLQLMEDYKLSPYFSYCLKIKNEDLNFVNNNSAVSPFGSNRTNKTKIALSYFVDVEEVSISIK